MYYLDVIQFTGAFHNAKDSGHFGLNSIFGITSGGDLLISVEIFPWKFDVSLLTNRFFALIGEFGKGIESGKSHSIATDWTT